MKILLVEDDKDMQKIVRMYLEKEGFSVTAVPNGQEALDCLCQSQYSLAVIDWMMPVMDGIALCEAIREHDIPVRTLMLTAKDTVDDEITGLKCGADDYVKKPFDPKLLVLRIKKLLQLEDVLHCGAITLNQQTQIVTLQGEELTFTKKEFELLRMLMLNQGIILSRDKLLREIWGFDYEGEERTVDTHIRRLRSKIGDEYILTHVGLGYSMEDVKNEQAK